MTRSSGTERAESNAEAIEQAALQLFYERGYHGASVRAIADRAGVGIATLFHHGGSKGAILTRILSAIIDELTRDLERAVAGIEDPLERLDKLVRELVVHHCDQREKSFVAQSEIRNVEDPARSEILHRRAEVQRMFEHAIRDAIVDDRASGDAHETARAVVSMIVMIATWYRPEGSRSREQVADTYVHLARQLIGAPLPAGG